MALKYMLEFIYDDSSPSDASVFIQLRENTPIYQDKIDKEDYDVLEEEFKSEFITGLFNIGGVVEVSSTAYRVWLMKSPTFNWTEVVEPALYFIAEQLGESSIEEIPGSAKIDGEGFTLNEVKERRKI